MELIVRGAVHPNSYRDSVELMGIAAELERLPGVARAGLVMATPANVAVLTAAGLAEALTGEPRPNDLVVAVAAETADAAEAALGRAAGLLSAGAGGSAAGTGAAGTGAAGTADGGAGETRRARTIADALGELPDANLALVSTPGLYAAAEALKALKRGLHVFLFSDNVPLELEIELKRLASQRGLLVMGPDCGTAIIGGVPLGFANAVRRGPIGIAAASGTGLQQVACLVHRFGSGVSHALGTGGRDLDERIGGVTMLAAIDRLLDDPATDVLVLVSKPPSPSVAGRVLERVRAARKPVVVNFLGGDPALVTAAGAHPAGTFEAAARIATRLAAGLPPDDGAAGREGLESGADATIAQVVAGLGPGRRVLGLYSGGSLAGEAKLVLRGILGEGRAEIIDLGEDEYTVGRPHPMIDPRLRSERIAAAATDAGVGVVLLDVVLGHGSHPDPAGALAPSIQAAREAAAADGRELAVVASVCGTDDDPQGLAGQEAALAAAGVLLAPSNARAATLAGRIAAAADAGAGSVAVPAGGGTT